LINQVPVKSCEQHQTMSLSAACLALVDLKALRHN